MGLIRRILNDVRRGQDIDAYVTVVAAVLLSALNILGVLPASKLTGVVLAVLALLAIGALVTRARLETIAQVNTAGSRSLPTFPARYPPEYMADLEGDGDLYLYGVSMNTLITEIIHALERRLRLGSVVRVLLIQPGSPAARLAEDRMGIPADYERRRYQTQSSLDHLSRLANDVGGNLEVRLTDQELNFEVAIVNPSTSRATMYLRYYSYRVRSMDSLRLTIRSADGQWYDYHLEQIKALWDDATAWMPDSVRQQTPGSASDSTALSAAVKEWHDALELARHVERDHKQRALERRYTTREDVSAARDDLDGVLTRLAASGETISEHVRPWVWTTSSEGEPLTDAGRQTGMELRLTYYKSARRNP